MKWRIKQTETISHNSSSRNRGRDTPTASITLINIFIPTQIVTHPRKMASRSPSPFTLPSPLLSRSRSPLPLILPSPSLSPSPSTVSRQWYDTHPPPDNNPSPSTFLIGLTSSPRTSTAYLNEVFTNPITAHHLWELPPPTKDDTALLAFYAATDEISFAVRVTYPGPPQRWVECWVRALVMESYEHPGSPIFADADAYPDADADSDPDRTSRTIPLHLLTFVITVLSPPDTECIVELVSSRCLASGQPGTHPSEYQFSLFYSHFQTVVKEKNPGMELDLERNRIHWARNGVLRVIESQHDFEVAITHLYNERASGWELSFSCLPFRGYATEEVVGEEIAGKEIGEGLWFIQSIFSPPDTSTSRRKGREEAPDQGGVESAASQKADSTTQTSIGNDLAGVDELGGTMEDKIEYMITKTKHWRIEAEEAMKRAGQRVKAAKRKEKDGSMQGQVEKRPRHSNGGKPKPPVPQRSSSLKTSIPPATTGRTTVVPPKVSAVINRKPVPSPSNASSFQQTPTTRVETSSPNTSTQSSIYVMTDKERREKTANVRRQFPAHEMPSLQATGEALGATGGNVDEAFLLLGGMPKKNTVPPRSQVRRSTKNVGDRPREAKPVSEPAPEAPPLAPRVADAQEPVGSRKRSLSGRIQNVAHAAGRRLSIGGSKTRGAAPPQDPTGVEIVNFEFTVTKEQAYKSGGDDEDVVNPLDRLQKADEKMEPYENEEGERADGKAKDVASL
jgi:hypothetical protein